MGRSRGVEGKEATSSDWLNVNLKLALFDDIRFMVRSLLSFEVWDYAFQVHVYAAFRQRSNFHGVE